MQARSARGGDARCEGLAGAASTATVATQREASRWARQAASLIASVQSDELRDDLRLRFEERAAICEIDGRLARAEAERVAYDALVKAAQRARQSVR